MALGLNFQSFWSNTNPQSLTTALLEAHEVTMEYAMVAMQACVYQLLLCAESGCGFGSSCDHEYKQDS